MHEIVMKLTGKIGNYLRSKSVTIKITSHFRNEEVADAYKVVITVDDKNLKEFFKYDGFMEDLAEGFVEGWCKGQGITDYETEYADEYEI